MMKQLFIVALLFALCACEEEKYSDLMEEPVEVVAKNYIPAHTISYPVTSVDTDGDIEISIESDDVPEWWQVKFKCMHGQFSIEGIEVLKPKAKELYNTYKVGDKLYCQYKEVYYEREKDGKMTRHHKDFWFVGVSREPKSAVEK
jgi:hypothetical protein